MGSGEKRSFVTHAAKNLSPVRLDLEEDLFHSTDRIVRRSEVASVVKPAILPIRTNI